VEKDSKQGHKNYPTTKAGERSEKSRAKGSDRNKGGEFQNGHLDCSIEYHLPFSR
jgi:hypothetical protein